MLKGLGQLGDMAKIMKQAQEMQSRMAEAQNRLDAIEVVGEAGAGLVRVTATAKGAVKALSIDPSLFKPEEREVVEDLIVAAVQDAQARADGGGAGGDGQGDRGPRPAAGAEAAVLSPTRRRGCRAVDRLIALMARLPGLGPRSARRAVLTMVRRREAAARAAGAGAGRGGGDGARVRRAAATSRPASSARSAPTRAARPASSASSRRWPTSGRWSAAAPSAAATTCSAACSRRSTAVGPEALRIPELVARGSRTRRRAR